MSGFHKASSWRQVFGLLAGSLVILLLLFYIYDASRPPFFTTQSPNSTYTVNLYGQKERPAIFTVEVGAVVLKNGQSFWPYQTLHTGDFMDLSFELGWPDHRWIGENILQLYREENYSESRHPEKLLLVNKTENAIKHLRINSNNDKFLGFDLQSGSEIRLEASASKGDSSGIWITGQFDDGRGFEKSASFSVKNISYPLAYKILVTDEGVNIEMATADSR